MAPKTRGASSSSVGVKRKKTVRRPVREPTPVSSSTHSSDDSLTPAASTPKVDLFASRVVTTGRKFDFSLFEREGLIVGSQLKEMGFERICSLDCPTYPALVKEFYKNLCRGDNGLVSSVRGVSLNVSAVILSKLLRLSLSGPSTFDPEDRSPALTRLLNRPFDGFVEILANQLPLDLRLLHNICSRILFPKTGRFDYVSERDIFVMDAVVSGRPINLPNMILWYMADCGSKRKSSLPYGMVLTEIFRSQGIQIDESEPKKILRHTDYYTLATVHRMGFIRKDGMWERKTASEERAVDIEAPGPSIHRASPELPPDFGMPDPVPASAPSPAPVFDQASSSSAGFNETQLEQLRSLFIEFDSQRTNQFNQLKEDFNTLKEEIHSRYDSLSLSIGDAVQSFRSDLQRIFDRMEGIADGSGAYVHATEQLRQDINLAIIQIDSCIGKFKDEQKEEFMDIIGHLKKIVFKNFK